MLYSYYTFRMGLKKTIANLLTQPSMIEEKKKIKKAKQGLIFRTGRSDTRNLIERTIRKALAANEELTSVLANYKIRLRSLDFIRADDEDEIDAYIPPQLNFINKTQSQVDEEQKKSHQRIQMAKDMIFMSDKNYEVFRNISQLEMPSLTSVKCIRVIIIFTYILLFAFISPSFIQTNHVCLPGRAKQGSADSNQQPIRALLQRH